MARMCPIETPEGPNIGLISYLATYARINEYGFIEAPFRAVDHETCRVSDDITYMTADVEDQYVVGQAAEPVDENGCLTRERITCRHRDEIVEVDRDRVDYIDISPAYDGLHRDGDDPVPAERRREPRTDGRKHAASGRAAHGHRSADRRHRHRAQVRS